MFKGCLALRKHLYLNLKHLHISLMVILCYSKQVDVKLSIVLFSTSVLVLPSYLCLTIVSPMTQNLTGIALKPADGTDIWKL